MNNAIYADHVLRELAITVARNQVGAMRPIAEVLAGEQITEQEYAKISKNPTFIRYVDTYAADLKENGFSFSAKSKLLAEDLLPTAYHMAKDPDTPAAVRAKLLENLVEWGDLKPKSTHAVAPGAGFSITINLPSPATAQKPVENVVVVEESRAETAKTAQNQLLALENAPPRVTTAFCEAEDYEYAGDDVY